MGGRHHEHGTVPVSARKSILAVACDVVAAIARPHPDAVEGIMLALVVAVPMSLALFMVVSP